MAISDSNSIQRSLNRSSKELTNSFEKLSSGRRINKASDDAAGLAIAEALASDAVVLRQGSRNAADTQSAIQIADSALSQVSDITIRMSELAAQSANGTLSDSQRETLNTEYQALSQEVQRIGSTTTFNGSSLLDGSSTITAQVGTDGSSSSQISAQAINYQALVTGAVSSSISSIDSARAAIDQLSQVSQGVASSRGELGSTSVRLGVASANNEEGRITALSAESRIRDADIAQETANKIAAQVKQQTGVALAAQSNINMNKVMDLLK